MGAGEDTRPVGDRTQGRAVIRHHRHSDLTFLIH